MNRFVHILIMALLSLTTLAPIRASAIEQLSSLSPGTTERVSVASDGTQANGVSLTPSISADGRFVAFASHASNLVPGDTNGNVDVFVHDRQTGMSEIVSVASDGTQGNDTS